MAETQIVPQCKLHRLFKFYDPEVVAVMTILLGLFQVLLGLPAYYMNVSIPMLVECPFVVGTAFLAGGSLAMACERSPSIKLVKGCLYSSVFGLVAGLSAIVVYGYALNHIKSLKLCQSDELTHFGCPEDRAVEYYHAISAVLLIYDMGSLTLDGFLLFSAIKTLKTN